ncbi:MAG: hypothetical protein AB7K63_11790, partial [Vicinamibacterales bacterium]
MNTADLPRTLAHLYSELANGTGAGKEGFVLNSGDVGLHASLDRLSAEEASRSANDGATIAAHAQHVRYGLSLMNRWAREGGNPFADATWEAAWETGTVDAATWDEIRRGLRREADEWLKVLGTAREVQDIELTGMVASIAHL